MAKKLARGRPSKYKPIYCKKIVEYFRDAPLVTEFVKERTTRTLKDGGVVTKEIMGQMTGDMPTIIAFAHSIGTTHDAISRWEKKHKDFHVSYNEARDWQKQWLIKVGVKGLAPPAAYIFTAKNISDMRDKQEVDHTSKGEKVQQVVGFTYINPEKPDDADKSSD